MHGHHLLDFWSHRYYPIGLFKTKYSALPLSHERVNTHTGQQKQLNIKQTVSSKSESLILGLYVRSTTCSHKTGIDPLICTIELWSEQHDVLLHSLKYQSTGTQTFRHTWRYEAIHPLASRTCSVSTKFATSPLLLAPLLHMRVPDLNNKMTTLNRSWHRSRHIEL